MAESIDTILQQSQSKKIYTFWHYGLGALLLVGLIVGGWYWFSTSNTTKVVYVPELYTVKTGSIKTTVSSDGNIINPDIVNLSFLINGTLKKLYVEEGDKVEAGQIIAELDKRDLEFDLKAAENDVNIAWQNIKAKEAEITDLDIINAQNDLSVTIDTIENSRSSVEKNLTIVKTDNEIAVKNAEQDFEQAFLDAKISISEAFFSIQDSLTSVDYVFGIERNYGSKTIANTVFNDSANENNVEVQFYAIKQSLDALKKDYESRQGVMENADISLFVWKLKILNDQVQQLFDLVVLVFDSASGNSSVGEETIASSLASVQSYQSKVKSLGSSLQQAKNKIDSAYLALQNTYSSTKNKLESAELEINNTLIKLENDKKTAQLKVANAQKTVTKADISKKTSLQIQYAQLEQAKLRVEKAKYELSLADLVAPKDGTIISLSASEGESLKSDTTSSENAFIRILSDANFTTEVYVEEADIAKIKLGQTAQITLEAIPNSVLDGVVDYIASTSTKDNNGIITYLVRISIANTKEQPIREGMTTYVDFILGAVSDVIVIPAKAIVRGGTVFLADNKKVTVEIGFSDGEMTEIKSGLKVDETIIVNPETGNNGGNNATRSVRELTPERIDQFKKAGLTDDEIKKIQAGEVTDAIREKMQELRGATTGGGGGRVGGGPPR